MVNLALLAEEIENSGLKKQFVAQKLGLTLQGLSNKMNGASDFKVGEAEILANLLGLEPDRLHQIFFALASDF